MTLTPHHLLVPWSSKSIAIPLLPLWAVRPIQILSACTVQLYLYSPYGPYGLYRSSVPVQYSYTSTSLSACTVQLYLYSPYGPYDLYRPSVPVQYSYTSTPPMGRTACKDPQFLYSTAIPLLPLWAVRPVKILSSCTRVHFNFLSNRIQTHTQNPRLPDLMKLRTINKDCEFCKSSLCCFPTV